MLQSAVSLLVIGLTSAGPAKPEIGHSAADRLTDDFEYHVDVEII
jgi:hypothetical protein